MAAPFFVDRVGIPRRRVVSRRAENPRVKLPTVILVDRVGIEPTTLGLRGPRSTN